MRWRKLVDDFFRHNEEGTVTEIKWFIENKYLHLFREEAQLEWEKNPYKHSLKVPDFNLSARRQIRQSCSLANHLKERMREGEFARKEGISGMCTWIYFREEKDE